MIKKMFIIMILLFATILVSCSPNRGTYVEEKILIIDKYTAIESKYNLWWDKYRTYTAYYLVFENKDITEVDNKEYYAYEIGDYYTIKVWKEIKEE